ncbi:MAG: hypothetical protein K2X81_20045, partial [Candidatus Obscuribacterales bacterium]|nr:hypothetical protein [Candidatus Obscuribacterales bacterium]
CANTPWKVIVLSAEYRDAFIEAVVEAGAYGFLSKSEPQEMVIDAIKKVAAGVQLVFSSEILGKPPKLTAAQKHLLSFLGQGMRYQEIAELRNTKAETVRKQCDFLQVRLGLSSREQLISWAVEHGYASLDRESLT